MTSSGVTPPAWTRTTPKSQGGRSFACGAIQACADKARELVEAGWAKAEPLLEPSLSRVMLRAFGWYVLERHY